MPTREQPGPGATRAVILFDGACGLCNRCVAFVAARDLHRRFEFEALQSDAGVRLLARHGMDAEGIDTIVLLESRRVSTRSTAVLRILRRLPFPWPLLYGLIAIPRPLRDGLYRWVAARRPRMGEGPACPV